MKTTLGQMPEISLKRPTIPSLQNSRSNFRTLVSNKTARLKQRLENLYTNASYVFHTADERKIDEAKRKHGDKYLIKLFPKQPRLVIHELETISQDRFRELYNDFVLKYGKDLPDIREQIKGLRKGAMDLRLYRRHLDGYLEDASRKKYTELIEEVSQNLNKLTDDFLLEIETARIRSMVPILYKRGTRRNGLPLARLRGPQGKKTILNIQSYL
jgi:hypothetical protein